MRNAMDQVFVDNAKRIATRNLAVHGFVEIEYVDSKGQREEWLGQVEKVSSNYFTLLTDRGYRSFNYEPGKLLRIEEAY